ncbi:MAG: peptidoglycan-binding protein [Clostridia bacterium]|nr:peptidoglycan-binding protein [Clostridia bacterium]
MNRRRTVFAALILILGAWLAVMTAGAETYPKLRPGDSGAEVRRMQQALIDQGYLSGRADGKFGPATEAAVRTFQRRNGLKVDGIAGSGTLAKLYGASQAAKATPVPKRSGGVADGWFGGNYRKMEPGQTGRRIQLLQAALLRLNFYSGLLDGKYGPGTRNAVSDFQRSAGLTRDGKAGQQTLLAIEARLGGSNTSEAASKALRGAETGGQATAKPTQAPAVTPAPASTVPGIPTRTLQSGSSGSDVRTLQTRLAQLGFFHGTADGVYGSATQAAVTAFQTACRLYADGIAGPKTLARLFAADAPAAQPAATLKPDPQAIEESADKYLTFGSTGSAVTKLQNALLKLGYSVGTGGKYDSMTRSAVEAFQRRNGLYVDGIAGPNTLAILYSGNCAGPGPDITPLPAGAGSFAGPSAGQVKLLHWFNEVKPTLKNGQTLLVYDPATGLAWNLRILSRGRHCDAEPLTLQDTQIMVRAFGNRNTWDQKAVYVRLPSGVWVLGSTHDMPHLSGSIKDNGFNGHLCVHFLRDMEECMKNDPNYGVANQKTIRKKWKEMTGIDVP